jgi:hypothetical protein
MTQHASLSPERWSRFSRDQQILMIANEMQRASALLADADEESRRRCYERVLRLVDLTVQVQTKRTFRRELLRWRDLVAALYVDGSAVPRHREVFRALLQFTPDAFRQAPYLTG